MTRSLPPWASLRLPIHKHGSVLSRRLTPQFIEQSSKVRFQSIKASEHPQVKSPASRFDRFIAKTPTKFLRSRLQALRSAPLTHITAFLLLHELTAIIPLFGLASAFHYYEWLPPYFAEGAWVLKGVTMFGNYFRKKGWIDSKDAEKAAALAKQERAEEVEGPKAKGILDFGKWWNRGEGGTRLVIEFATAYAIVKALMPIRIVISIWGAPWFAKWTVIPVQRAFMKRFSVGKGR